LGERDQNGLHAKPLANAAPTIIAPIITAPITAGE
jgi:hypothetical protein